MAKNIIKEIHHEFIGLDSDSKKRIICIALNLFLLLFSYPFIRSASTAFFLEYYGAKNSPWVWILSVVALSFSVALFNKWQKKHSIFFIYSNVAVFSSIMFIACNFLFMAGLKWAAFPYYIWKEVYIILLVHLSIGYLNTKIDYKVAKLTYGPLGALGSFGGILGGYLTAKIIPVFESFQTHSGLYGVGLLGTIFVLLTLLLFHSTRGEFLKTSTNETPLSSISSEKKYVALICMIVALSQFVINLANFKFNLGIEAYVNGVMNKGVFLGKVYAGINAVSFTFQILLVPILFKIFRVKTVHLAIPIIFGIFMWISMFNMGGILPVAALFICYKGLDYSLFSTAKEMLYFPLTQTQKYGAKYVVDMIVYRSSKMLISAVLLLFSSALFVDSLLFICLIVWSLLVGLYLRKTHSEN